MKDDTPQVNQRTPADDEPAPGQLLPSDHALVETLFDLGRQVTSVLDFEELLQRIPLLIRRLIPFEAFAVYLLDERRNELRIAYSVGYPISERPERLKFGEGLVGAAVEKQEPLLVNDLEADPRYVEFVAGMNSEIVVPLLHKSKPIREVVAAIRAACAGEPLLTTQELVALLRTASERRAQDELARRSLERLTPREREILAALAEGLGDKAIAQRLNISEKTVRNHMTRLLDELGVESRLQALILAIRYGVVRVD